ncbi:MAG: InlB B-repeat-containing protein [Lachnospiraceae bacterium]|nr:InlB B-repeat-containing protein [Lachnospiraceae bacterium]
MGKAKNLSNKLMAALLSIAMILTTILPSMPVYATEIGIEAETDTTLQDDGEPGNSESDNGGSDETDFEDEDSNESNSENESMDENVSDSETSEGTDEGETGEDIEEADTEEIFDDEASLTLDEELYAVSATEFSNVGGWNESIYAEIAGVQDADVTEVSYTGPVSGTLEDEDFEYLVRNIADNRNQSTNKGVRIDIPGLKAGTYTLTVKVGGKTITKDDIEVTAYDRSGYAHFNYTKGVGAYNDDGTLKDNAIVIYVTDENKNSVKIPYNNDSTKGIGNIFTKNSNIVKTLADKNIPLVVRFVGTVSESGLYERGEYKVRTGEKLITGLSKYEEKTDNNGEPDGDNGHMATITATKDLTIEGIGYDATIDGWGFQFTADKNKPNAAKSIEVRNLTFINTPEDAIGMEGQQEDSTITVGIERCWIHNNSLYCPNILEPLAEDKYEGDGSIDFKRGQYLTCSYNYFEGCHKSHLVGASETNLQYNLTYHHNYWYMCKSRGPLTRNANVHMYNNLVYMQTNYAQNARENSYIFSEYNIFYACQNPQNISEPKAGYNKGAIKSYNDSFSSVKWNNATKGTVVTNKSDSVINSCGYAAGGVKYDKFDTEANLSYIPGNDYQLQTDFTDLAKVIASQTGVQAREPKSVTNVIENDYSVIKDMDVTVDTIDVPKTKGPFSITSKGYAFKVDKPFDLKIEYADAQNAGVFVNAAGENLLKGNGSIRSLPAGTYMILSAAVKSVASYSKADCTGTPAVFNDITVKSLEITGGTGVQTYTIYFDHNDGSQVESDTIYSNQRYEITKVPTRDGYDFEGWYSAREGGNKVSSIDGSALTGDITLYAHWKKQGKPYTLSLDCSKDLDQFVVGTADSDDKGWNITETTEPINGFIIHAASGSKKVDEKTTIKYYMTIKDVTPKTLGTNGVLITDKTIPGNEDGLLKSIEFTTKGQGVLTAEMALSGSTESGKKYNIVLGRKSSNGSLEEVVSHSITNGTTKTTFIFEFDEAGTYYLYPEGDKGVVYYTLNVQGIEDEEVVQPEEYTVKFDAGEGTLSDGAAASVTAFAGANVSLPGCTPPVNKTFTGWLVGNSTEVLTSTYIVNAADADDNNIITLNAVYTAIEENPKQYTVKFDAGEGTLSDGASASVTALAGANVSLPGCTPPTNKTFTGWSVGNSTEVLTSTYIVKAVDADENNEITLRAVYTDNGPQGGGDGPVMFTVTFTYPETVTISFKGNEHTLADNKISVEAESEVSFKPVPDEEYEIESVKVGGASGDAVTVNGEGYYVITVSADTEVVITASKKEEVNPPGPPDTGDKTGIRIEGLEGPFYYTGAKIIPDITVKDYSVKDYDGNYGKVLTPGVDYTVKYSNNVKATADPTNKVGKAKVTVTGKGNYTGKDTEETFEIIIADRFGDSAVELADLKGAKIDKIDPLTYTGDYQYPKFTLTIKNKTPKTYEYDGVTYVTKVEDKETAAITYEPINVNWAVSNNLNKGTATLLLTGAAGSNGKATTLKKTFKINAIDLSKADVGVEEIAPVPYSVKGAVVPNEKIVVKVNGIGPDKKTIELKNGIDYTVKFTSNKNATNGAKTANVVITGKGNFAKKPTNKITYAIDKLDMEELEISAVTAYDGIKAGKVKATVLDKSGNILKASQYTVEVYKPADGKKVKCADSEVLKSGEENNIYVVARAKDTKNLVADSSTPLETADAFGVGKNIAKAKFTVNKNSETGKAAKMYTGDEITLDADDITVTIKEDGKTKTLYMKGSHNGIDEGYEIVGYTNNINKGTATVIIKGIGEYSGTKTLKFKIVAKKMDIFKEEE